MKNDTWTVFTGYTDKTIGSVNDCGGNGRGPQMPIAQAQEIVDAHNRDLTPQPIISFADELSQFIGSKLVNLVNPSNANYWPLIRLMTDGAVTQLQTALEENLVDYKSK